MSDARDGDRKGKETNAVTDMNREEKRRRRRKLEKKRKCIPSKEESVDIKAS